MALKNILEFFEWQRRFRYRWPSSPTTRSAFCEVPPGPAFGGVWNGHAFKCIRCHSATRWRLEAAAPSGYRHLLLCPSPIAAGLLRVHAEDKPVQERFIVGPVHRDDPTLSASEARIQWYREPSRQGTSLAAVDGRDVCSALLCPLRSTPLAVAAFMTVGTKSFSSALSARSSLRMVG